MAALKLLAYALLLLSAALPTRKVRHWRETSSESIWMGRYGNCDHGYFVLLPPGVLGHDSPPLSSRPEFLRLDTLRAVSRHTSYVEKGVQYKSQMIAALSHDKAIEYTLVLDTTQDHALEDMKLFQKIVAGFHTSQIDNSGRECSNE